MSREFIRRRPAGVRAVGIAITIAMSAFAAPAAMAQADRVQVAETRADKVRLTGRTFQYAIGKYRIEIHFEGERRLRWTYLQAPGSLTGRTAVEKVDRTDLRPDLILLAWTEKDGTHVTDIFDLRRMNLHASTVFKGKRFFLKTPFVEVKAR